jgi:hypothetical protein
MCVYLPIYLSTALQPFVRPWPLFSFLIVYTFGRIPWTGDQLVARPLLIHRTTLTENKRTQTFMPRVGFEPTIPAFERAKTVDASDRTATVIDNATCTFPNLLLILNALKVLSPWYNMLSVVPRTAHITSHCLCFGLATKS